MHLVFFDDKQIRNQLKPLTLTRPIADLRIGINTLREKWLYYSGSSYGDITESYLGNKFPENNTVLNQCYINSSVLPNDKIWDCINRLTPNQKLLNNNLTVAVKTDDALGFEANFDTYEIVRYEDSVSQICSLPDLFLKNADQISYDFGKITQGRKSHTIEDEHTKVYALENIFIEEGVSITSAILNAKNGPIYIGKNAVIQEGSVLIGPVAIGTESMVAFGARIRPNTSLGPVCRVGGEVGNSIFMGYSNKAHDGFLGNSVIGEWCNLGANTNNSNLKNDYTQVKLYDYHTQGLKNTGELFCGTFMGDYSKAGISTMFNTGTVVGVSANVFGADFQDKYIPSFSWGGAQSGYESYRFDKAIQVINATMARRQKELSNEELTILRWISENES